MYLSRGANEFTVTVTAQNGDIQDYDITVYVALPPIEEIADFNNDSVVDINDFDVLSQMVRVMNYMI